MCAMRIVVHIVENYETQCMVLEEFECVAVAYRIDLNTDGTRSVIEQMAWNVADGFVSPGYATAFGRPVVGKSKKYVFTLLVENVEEGDYRIGQVFGDGIEDVNVNVFKNREFVDRGYFE